MRELRNEVEVARTQLAGLVFSCPFKDPRPECPLEPLRQLPVRGRIARLFKMTDEEVLEIVRRHDRCVCDRETWRMQRDLFSRFKRAVPE